ncbi:MAG: hypothetical protein V3V39_05615 [Desulfobacterales bacterium]|jgi:hypothetical protein
MDIYTQKERFKHLNKEDVSRIQGMVEEDWNNLLRKTDEVLS